MSASFKQEMTEKFIPAIRDLLAREEAHLAHLKKSRKFLIDKTTVNGFIERSREHIEHFKMRLKQYEEYAGKM